MKKVDCVWGGGGEAILGILLSVRTTLLAMAFTSSVGPTRSEVPESRIADLTEETDVPDTSTSSISICQYPFFETGTYLQTATIRDESDR